MASGVPVVASDVPGIRDVVRHEETGLLFDLKTPMQLALSIVRVIEEEDLRATLIANGLKEVRERFGWERVLRTYRELLNIG
jgi:glycosyltransferase involved in cell wall biosynthesis